MPDHDTQISSDGIKSASMVCAYCGYVGTEDVRVCPNDGTALKVMSQHSLVGSVLSERYKILSLLGTGGMGSVYKAKQLLLDKIVAVKVLHGSVGADEPDRARRFRQEGKVISSLSHPNIVGALDFGVENGQAFLVMDFVAGTVLYDVIMRRGHIAVSRAVHIFTQICDAMEYAHGKGIIHRDLKPSNVMLTKDETEQEVVKLLDFGVAKMLKHDEGAPTLTKTGMVFGSPPYMSPEQCLGQPPDARSDIYSLGCIMYETLTGINAIAGQNSLEILHNQISSKPSPFAEIPKQLHIPESIESVVFKSLAKDPHQRYQSMAEMKKDLLKAVADNRFRAGVISAPSAKPTVRTSWILAGTAASAIIAIAVGFFSLSKTQSVTPQERQALSESAGYLQLIHSGKKLSEAQYAAIENNLKLSISYEEKKHGADNQDLVNYLAPLAQCLIQQGKMGEFETVYERAAKLAANSPRAANVFDVHIQYISELVQNRDYGIARTHSQNLWQSMKREKHTKPAQMKQVLSLLTESCNGLNSADEGRRFLDSEIAEAKSAHRGNLLAILNAEAASVEQKNPTMLAAMNTATNELDSLQPLGALREKARKSELAEVAVLPSNMPSLEGATNGTIGPSAGGHQPSSGTQPARGGALSGTQAAAGRASTLSTKPAEPGPEELQRAEQLDVEGARLELKGIYGRAHAAYEQALSIRKRLNRPTDQAAVDLSQLGKIEFEQKEYKDALQRTTEALEMVSLVDPANKKFLATLNSRLGALYIRLNQPAAAQQSYEKALAQWEPVSGKSSWVYAESMEGIAESYFDRKNWNQAEPWFNKVETIYNQKKPDSLPLFRVRRHIADIYANTSRWETAYLLATALEPMSRSDSIKSSAEYGFWLDSVARSAAHTKHFDVSRKYFDAEMNFWRQRKDPKAIASVLIRAARSIPDFKPEQ